MKIILVTGGSGFIGSNFIRLMLQQNDMKIINLDKLTYAAKKDNLRDVRDHPQYHFIHGDLAQKNLVRDILKQYQPNAVVHFAAESHVDRSIHNAQTFIDNNIMGGFHLVEAVRVHLESLPSDARDMFRLVNVSTDEVYGSLDAQDPAFHEDTPFRPNSPYSASKAANDHIMRSFYHTYGVPIITSHCSNNYGPYQFPEKLIPLMILNALQDKELPIYGDGKNIRDWLYVDDHCRAIACILDKGKIGENYNIGGNCEKTNTDIVHYICDYLDQHHPRADTQSYRQQIRFVADRLGHDRRYAIDQRKIQHELGWQPLENFDDALHKTIDWYANNQEWLAR